MNKTTVIIKTSLFNDIAWPAPNRPFIYNLFERANRLRGGNIKVEMSLPYKERTTGKEEQNRHFHGHCRDIALQMEQKPKVKDEATYTTDKIKWYIKKEAMGEREYPMEYNSLSGEWEPISSKTDTITFAKLIDEAHQKASEFGFWLIEKDEKTKIKYKSLYGYTLEEMNKYYPELNKGE